MLKNLAELIGRGSWNLSGYARRRVHTSGRNPLLDTDAAFKKKTDSRADVEDRRRRLPIVSLISLFTGMVLALQSAYQMQKISAEMYIASLVALSMTRELGPVLTAL